MHVMRWVYDIYVYNPYDQADTHFFSRLIVDMYLSKPKWISGFDSFPNAFELRDSEISPYHSSHCMDEERFPVS